MSVSKGKFLLFKGTKGYMNHFDDHVHVYSGDILEVVEDAKATPASMTEKHQKVVGESHAQVLVNDYPNNFIVYNQHPNKAQAAPAKDVTKAPDKQIKDDEKTKRK